MATTLVRNQIGAIVKHFRLPADVEAAQQFCDLALEGKYWLYKKVSEQGSPEVSEAILVKVLLRNNETGEHFYLTFYVKPTIDKEEVKEALSGWTGIDDIIVLDYRKISFPTGEGSSSGG